MSMSFKALKTTTVTRCRTPAFALGIEEDPLSFGKEVASLLDTTVKSLLPNIPFGAIMYGINHTISVFGQALVASATATYGDSPPPHLPSPYMRYIQHVRSTQLAVECEFNAPKFGGELENVINYVNRDLLENSMVPRGALLVGKSLSSATYGPFLVVSGLLVYRPPVRFPFPQHL